jgi:extracellular elastinolytic metalloproteinase
VLSTPSGARRVTHLFYIANWYHDQLFALGFDEAAGNFQAINFSGQAIGRRSRPGGSAGQFRHGQRQLLDAARWSIRAHADVSFIDPTIDRDGGLDAEIVIHELTHGLSNRLIGNGSGLNWGRGRGHGRRLERLLRTLAAQQHQRG